MWFGARSRDVGKAADGDRRVRLTPQTTQCVAANFRSLMEQSARHAERRQRRAELGAGEARFQPPTLIRTERGWEFRVA